METTIKKSKEELLSEARKIADEHTRLKQTIEGMLVELDKLELQHIQIFEELKKS